MFGQLFRFPRAADVNLAITPARRTGSKAQVRRGGLIMRIPLAAALAAASCFVVAAPASASQNQVSGIQAPGGTAPACGDTSASFTMTGGLVGCWYEDSGTQTKGQVTASGLYLYHFSGQEHFTGCLDVDGDGRCSSDDPSGTLYFTFTFTGQFEATPPYPEIRGRCHHPIVSGTGDFAGATGVINFKDDVSNGTSPYMGHVGF